MNEKEKLVPKRRFKEFKNSDAWEQRKLISEIDKVLDYRGKSPTKFGMNWGSTGYLVLSALNVKDGFIDKSIDAKYGDQALFERWMGVEKLEKGDVIFTTEAPLGNVAQIPDNNGYILNQRAVGFKTNPNNLNNNFLAQLLRSPLFQTMLQANASGGTAKGIGMKEFAKLDVTIPVEIIEQKQVGNFFNLIDETIALHQRKLDKAKELKSAYLSEMFPTEGERKPRRRFAGFTDDWEQRKVRELFTVTRGHVLAATKTKDKETDEFIYPVYSSQTKNNGLMGFYNQYLFENAITWTTDGANAGTVNFRKGKFYSTNVNGVLLSDKGYANKTISEIINKIAWKHVSKVGNPKLMNNIMSEISIMIPSIEEQNKISTLFNQIDNTIALHQQKLEKLQTIKKAYLNEMFI